MCEITYRGEGFIWTTAFSDKKGGDLDVKSFSTLNIALLVTGCRGLLMREKYIWSKVFKGNFR